MRSTIARLEEWLKENSDVGYIDPKSLGRDLRGISLAELLSALSHLVKTGNLEVVYKVFLPGQGLLGSAERRDYEFSSRAEALRAEVPSRSGRKVQAGEEGEIRPVFRAADF